MSKSSQSKQIQPLFDYVLIKPLTAEAVTPSGILIPDTAKEKPQMGTIMAVGTGSTDSEGKKVAMQVKVGQKVLYKKWGGNEIKVGTEEWLLVEQKDVMAIVG